MSDVRTPSWRDLAYRSRLVLWSYFKTLVAVLLSPVAEKNPVKVWAYRAPVVLSAERIICMGAAILLGRVVWRVPELLNGWPAATFAVFVVLALPISRALSRAPAMAGLEFAKVLVGRLGRGRGAQLLRGTSASAQTPVLPEYENDIDDLYSENDPAGLGHAEVGVTDRTDAESRNAAPERELSALVDPAPPEAHAPAPKPAPPVQAPAAPKPAAPAPAPALRVDQPWPSDPLSLLFAFKEMQDGVVEWTRTGESNPRIEWYFEAGKTGFPKAGLSDAVAWCAAGDCASAEVNGVRSARSAAARDTLGWGTEVSWDTVQRGDRVVFDRKVAGNPRAAHVAKYLGHDDASVYFIGGNQSNKWTVRKAPRSTVIGMRREPKP